MWLSHQQKISHYLALFNSFLLFLVSSLPLGEGKTTPLSQWHYAPASLLFAPTGRGPEVSCDFELRNDTSCDGWRVWQVDSELISLPTTTAIKEIRNDFKYPNQGTIDWRQNSFYRLNVENVSDEDGDLTGITYFSVAETRKVYLMSQEIGFTTRPTTTQHSLCFTYYYRLMATSSGRMKAYVLVRRLNETNTSVYNTIQLVWSEMGRWPATWSWLVNTVQLQLPKYPAKARVLFFLDAGDGRVALDGVEMYNSTCNLRPAIPLPNVTPSGAAVDSASIARTWPSTWIAYKIGLGFSVMQQFFIERILDDLAYHTCVSFVKRRRNEADYVEFIHTSEGCTSQRIGYYTGKQSVHLADNCFDRSTISHEIFHVIGLYHEHQRPDRDNYIIVLLDNIDPPYKEQFTKYTNMDSRLLSVPYHFGSVMHYRDNAFAARKGLKTMQPKNNVTNVTLGNLQGPVQSDWQKVANLYCGGATKPVVNANLPLSPPFRPNLWQNAEMPFEFDENLTSSQRSALLDVIGEMNVHTCLTIRPRRSEVDYVFFQLTNSECFSYSGRTGGRQVVSLFAGTCFSRSLLFWLILHAAGLDAEHRRPDRDDYITINAENISENHKESFQKFEAMDWRIMTVPYDVTSVLHYGSTAFPKSRGLNTITPKQNLGSKTLGNKIGPTPLDYAKILRLYNCSILYWKDVSVTTSTGQFVPATTTQWPVNPIVTGRSTQSSLRMVPPLWTSQRIPYVINEFQFNINEGRRIIHLIWIFNSKTCLQFVPRTNESDYVEFVKNVSLGEGCRASFYGQKGGRQEINLPSNACFDSSGYVINLALLTTAGLPEEHRRPDRDGFIQVIWNNIIGGAAEKFFTAYSAVDPRILTVGYDINSITHLTNEAFSKQRGLKTMVAKSNVSLPLGNDSEPAQSDYQKIAKLYC